MTSIVLSENERPTEDSTSPIVQNRNIRVITKHSIIPFKETKPMTEIKDLKVIEENFIDTKNEINEKTNKTHDDNNKSPGIDVKKNKRLSDVGLGAEELNKLMSKMNTEKKKDDNEEVKDSAKDEKKQKMIGSGTLTFNSSSSTNNNHNSNYNEISSPVKGSTMNNDNISMSPQKVIVYYNFFISNI